MTRATTAAAPRSGVDGRFGAAASSASERHTGVYGRRRTSCNEPPRDDDARLVVSRSRPGEIVIAQFPNVALWIFLASVVARAFVADGTQTESAAAWVGTGALTWWALDEVIRGVNPWRRVLGIGGCGFAIARVVSLIS